MIRTLTNRIQGFKFQSQQDYSLDQLIEFISKMSDEVFHYDESIFTWPPSTSFVFGRNILQQLETYKNSVWEKKKFVSRISRYYNPNSKIERNFLDYSHCAVLLHQDNARPYLSVMDVHTFYFDINTLLPIKEKYAKELLAGSGVTQ